MYSNCFLGKLHEIQLEVIRENKMIFKRFFFLEREKKQNFCIISYDDFNIHVKLES